MKIVKWIIVAVAAVLGLFVLITLFLPTEYYVERSELISAPATTIYAQVTDLEAWQEWNPWKEMDPEMELTYGNTTKGVGARYAWESAVGGDGEMTVVEAQPLTLVRYEWVFSGYESLPSFGAIRLVGDGLDGPVMVTWTFEGTVGDKLFARWMTLFMDKLVGENYEKGLKSLKERCENMPADSITLTKDLPVG